MFRPFSNGTDAMYWYANNCELCVKAYFPKDGMYPSDKTMKNYCSIGKECKLKYHIDWGFILGEIPDEIAEQIGKDADYGLKQQCMMFSDNEDDGYKPRKKPRPDDTPDNQILLFSEFDDLVNTPVVKLEKVLSNG